MRMSKLAIAAAGLTLCAGPALAQDADLEDARCIVIGYVVANQKDGALPGAMIISYFQGRIDGRGGKLNLVETVRAEGMAFDKLTDPQKQAMGDKCMAQMNAARKALEGLTAK
jgi:hypothetical protein